MGLEELAEVLHGTEAIQQLGVELGDHPQPLTPMPGRDGDPDDVAGHEEKRGDDDDFGMVHSGSSSVFVNKTEERGQRLTAQGLAYLRGGTDGRGEQGVEQQPKCGVRLPAVLHGKSQEDDPARPDRRLDDRSAARDRDPRPRASHSTADRAGRSVRRSGRWERRLVAALPPSVGPGRGANTELNAKKAAVLCGMPKASGCDGSRSRRRIDPAEHAFVARATSRRGSSKAPIASPLD